MSLIPIDVEVDLEGAKASGLLHLSFLQLMSVPASVFDVASLVRLDLGHNELTALPAAIGNLTRLEELWLNDNPLRSLPPEIQKCLSLRHLQLQCTDLTTLPSALGAMPSLVLVDVSGCGALEAALTLEFSAAGSLGVLAELRARHVRAGLLAALEARMVKDVFVEEGLLPVGREAARVAAAGLLAAFPEEAAAQLLIRHAAKLLPARIELIDTAAVRAKYEDMLSQAQRRQLGAELELLLRTFYFERIPLSGAKGDHVGARAQAAAAGVLAALPAIEDIQFVLEHAKELLPDDFEALAAADGGAHVWESAQELRVILAAEMADAQKTLCLALQSKYPEQTQGTLELCAAAIAEKLVPRTPTAVLALAADALEILPPDFTAVVPSAIARAFHKLQAEKGV